MLKMIIKLFFLNSNFGIANDTDMNTDGARATRMIFKGLDKTGTVVPLSEIKTAHDGTDDDNKSSITFMVNDGNDTDGNLNTIMTLGPSTQIYPDPNSANSVAIPDQTGMSNTQIKLDGSASGDDSYYNNNYISIVSGNASGQNRKIIGYVGNTKVATVDTAWTVQPAVNNEYYIYKAAVTIHGDLSINGATVTTTNTSVSDRLFELNSGFTGTPDGDIGVILEREVVKEIIIIMLLWVGMNLTIVLFLELEHSQALQQET